MPNPHFILGTYAQITSQPTDFCVRLPCRKDQVTAATYWRHKWCEESRERFQLLSYWEKHGVFWQLLRYIRVKNMARQKANCTFSSVAVYTHKSYFCCVHNYNVKCQRANNGNKLHPANTSCVFYSSLVFAFRHDMELGTKTSAFTFQIESRSMCSRVKEIYLHEATLPANINRI